MTAPERIWATGQNSQPSGRWWHDTEIKTGVEYIRADLAAAPVRVRVKPLDLSYVMRHAFLSGVVAANKIPAGDPCIGPDLWLDYDPGPNPALARILAAIDVQPAPRDAQIDEATAFDRADWYWRTMDPDDCGVSPAEAVNRGMVGQFCVCEVASSYEGPTRYGFIAPVLDLESDDEEFLHFASQQEAIDAANERRAALAAVKGGDA